MKKITSLLLKKYSAMSGNKKIRIALNLSKTVRQVRKEGAIALGDKQWKPIRENFLK